MLKITQYVKIFIHHYPDTRLPDYPIIRILDYPITREKPFYIACRSNTRLPDYPDTQIPGYPGKTFIYCMLDPKSNILRNPAPPQHLTKVIFLSCKNIKTA